MFDETTLRAFREQLLRMSAQLRDDVAAIDEQTRNPSGGQGGGQLSNAPMHLADGGSDEFLHELNAVLLENEEFLATEAAEALARIEAGTFGRCEACEQPIMRERLEAMPHTRYCVGCSAQNGGGLEVNLNRGRPSLAANLAPDRPEAKGENLSQADFDDRRSSADEDIHAAETPGGGSADGGLAGTNVGRGDPDLPELQRAGGSSEFDVDEGRDGGDRAPQSGRAGGAVGGTPAGKRASRE